MKRIVVIGSGGVAAEIDSYLTDINTPYPNPIIEIIGFLDDSFDNFTINSVKYGFQLPWLGTVDTYLYKETEEYILGFANISQRKRVIDKLLGKNIKFANIIHPSAQIAKSAKIGDGNIIYPFCIIGPSVSIGNFNLITSYSFISHDCMVGNNNFFSTSGLSGNVNVGDNNFLGIRSTVIPSINIGNDNVIQAGMTIEKDIQNDETIFYRFKERITIIKK